MSTVFLHTKKEDAPETADVSIIDASTEYRILENFAAGYKMMMDWTVLQNALAVVAENIRRTEDKNAASPPKKNKGEKSTETVTIDDETLELMNLMKTSAPEGMVPLHALLALRSKLKEVLQEPPTPDDDDGDISQKQEK